MICVYDSNCTDFSNNGLGIVQPTSCTVTEKLNGEWEMQLIHPIDEDGKWTRLAEGRILRVPVPSSATPQVNLVTQQYQTTTYQTQIYKVTTQSGPLHLRSGTGTKYKILGKYKKGTEIIVLAQTTSSWYEVTCPDGRHGYMSAQYLTFQRTEEHQVQIHVGFQNQVIESRQLRDQPFRIYRVVPDLTKVTVYARHIFYDLLDNMVQSFKPSASAVGASVVQSLAGSCLSPHDFTFYSDLDSTADGIDLENKNPVEVMLGEGGIAEKYGAELARDWFDVFLVKRVGTDSNVQIREGKNLLGVSYDVNETNAVTRIMPTGEDKDGNILYLPELYVDGPNISVYDHPKWMHLSVASAKEKEADKNSNGNTSEQQKNKAECYTEMRAAAQAQFSSGCDLPTVSLSVDFINCADTEEYKQYKFLNNIYLGDSVRVVAKRIGVAVSMRMTSYTYDCLTKKYTSVTLGTSQSGMEDTMVSAHQLASGSISGNKLALNSIGAGQLQNGAVGSLQIKNAAISSAHIQTAAITQAHIAQALIDTLNANAITAVSAKIQELAAGHITADELYTSIAMIATAQLTTANIVNANIDWAQIQNLSAQIAEISKAQITTANINSANIDWAAITALSSAVASIVNANIETADISWAQIKDLTTDTAIITKGVNGKLYVADLAVTEANMASLTVGELVVKGSDGHFYSVSVDADGNVTTSVKQISNTDVQDVSINAGEKLIEGSVTTACLNAQEIFADNALIRNLIAANLDVDALFAREATINAINAMDIRGNTYLRLLVDSKADQSDLEGKADKSELDDKADKSDVDSLESRVTSAELKLTDESIVSTVTGSQQYRDDLAAISASSSGGSEFIIGTQTAATANWTGNVTFTELHDGQQITYWLPQSCSSNASLKLTLGDGSETENIPCYYSQTQRITAHYPAGNIIHLTYHENASFINTTVPKGWWADANYNTDTYDRVRMNTPVKAKSNISSGRFIVGDSDGYFVLSSGTPFDISKPVLYATVAIAANSSSSFTYISYPFCNITNTKAGFTGAANKLCYIVGTLNGTTFTPNSTLLTCDEPTADTAGNTTGNVDINASGNADGNSDGNTAVDTEEDDLVYIALGVMTNTTQLYLFPEHPLYKFFDGKFQALEQMGYEAYAFAKTVQSETRTAIEQTNTAIALKADKTETDSLSTRLSSAEQKITPEQICATVTQSKTYAFSNYEGRNYCLDSGIPFAIVNNVVEGTTSNSMKTLQFSSDLMGHSNNGNNLRISFDIKRTNIDASSAASANCYSGVWIYYTYYGGTDGTTLYSTGRGWMMRTTDSNFNVNDSGWVRMKYGPLSISSYNPVSLLYVAFGTANARGTTGRIDIRNVKVEIWNTAGYWSAAPEDIFTMNERMVKNETKIQQNANNISLKVNSSTYNNEKVYRSNTAPLNPAANLLWLDTSVSPNLLKRNAGTNTVPNWVVAGAEEVKSSGIYIGSNNVSITTENFRLQLLDPNNNENVLMEMSADGDVGFNKLYAGDVISDSVAMAYHGVKTIFVDPSYTGNTIANDIASGTSAAPATSATFRSLGEAVKTLNNRFLKDDVTIYLSPTGTGSSAISEIYEPTGVSITGIFGSGMLKISGNGGVACRLNSYISIKGCTAHIMLQNVSLRESRPLSSGNRNPYLVDLQLNSHVELNNCTFDANGMSYDAVYCKTTHLYLRECGLYNAVQGLEVFMGSAFVKKCKGACNWAMVTYAGYIIASETVPSGSKGAGDNGQMWADNTTVDSGTAITAVNPEDTTIQYATTTKSYRGGNGGGWRSDTLDLVQGAYSNSGYSSNVGWNYGCMWFGLLQNVLSGTTIKSATITLHRKPGNGSFSSRVIYLCAISNTLPNGTSSGTPTGTPNITANFGAIGIIDRDEQATFTVPIAAIQGLANGTYGGLCIYETPYNFGTTTYSRDYIRISGTDDAAMKPYLRVVYSGGSAVG